MPRLKGGHVVVTARASNFPAFVRKLEVSTLDENAAAQFLLDRTEADRSKSKDDAALALDAGAGAWRPRARVGAGGRAYCDRSHRLCSLSEALERESRTALAWTDATVTGSERTLATTWATSVARLSPESRRLLDRLAFLAPDPVPDSLLDVAVPGEAADTDAFAARGGLYAYSLISSVTAEDGGAAGLRRSSPRAGFRPPRDERRAPRAGFARGAGMGERSFRRRSRRRAELASSRSARAARARGRASRGRQRRSRSRRRGCSIKLGSVCLRLQGGLSSRGGRQLLVRRALAIVETELSARIIPMWRSASTISRILLRVDEPPRRSRTADATSAGDRRDELRPRSSQCGDPPQQSRGAASGHEPPRRGRAADAPRARDRRDRATARIIPNVATASTISRCCLGPRTASPRPSR